MIPYLLPAAVAVSIGQTALAWRAARSTDYWRQLERHEAVCRIFAGAVLFGTGLAAVTSLSSSLGLLAFAGKSAVHVFWGLMGVPVAGDIVSAGVMAAITKVHALRERMHNHLLSCVFAEGAKVTPSPLQNRFERLFIEQALCSLGLAVCGVSPFVFLTLTGLQLAAAKCISERTFVCFTQNDSLGPFQGGKNGEVASDLKIAYYAEVIFPSLSHETSGEEGALTQLDPAVVSPVQLRTEEKRGATFVEQYGRAQTVQEMTDTIRSILQGCLMSVRDTLSPEITLHYCNGVYDRDTVLLFADISKDRAFHEENRRLLEEFTLRATFCYVHKHTPREGKTVRDREIDITWVQEHPGALA